MKSVSTAILALSGVCVSAVAVAESADCRKDAQAFVNGPNGKKLSAASFVGSTAAPEPLRIEHPCTAGPCTMAYLSSAAQPISIPEGYAPTRLDGAPAKLEWRPLPRARGSQCENLVVLVVGPTPTAAPPASSPATAPAAAPGKPTATEEQVITARFRSGGLKEALSAFHDGRQVAALRPAIGESHGLGEAAAETLQILGQIVADRASAEAYRLVKLRLDELLHCSRAPASAGAASAPAAAAAGRRSFPKPSFPETCKVLRPLRMEDIATSRDALLGAVSADGLSYLQDVQNSLSPQEKQVEEVGAALVVSAIVIPLIIRPKLLADDSRARAIVGALEALVDKHWDDAKWQENKARHALAAGVLAYTRCAYEVSDRPSATVSDCNFAAYADAYAGAELDTQIAARALTAQLISVATLAGPQGQPDVVQRVLHAVDAVFASSCMLAASPLTSTAPTPVEFKCPPPPDRIDLNQPLPKATWLAFAQPILDAALERDSNALLASIAHVLEVFANAEYAQDHQRAFLLLGSLLQYSATYAAQTSANAEQLHEQRSKILESLTRSMSDRTARDGDGIWSMGGSLRLVGGVRVGGTKPAVLSPLGLPLGVGFDHVASGSAAGFHLEFSPIDLGQYVAYDNRAVVKTPEVADAVAPSVTFGVGWGRSLPLVLGATLGYSPAFQLNPSRNTKGVLNVGVILGIYVPLIDMN